MNRDTNDAVCPRCGSADTTRRPGLFGSGRMCRVCRKRYSPPSPRAWEIVVAMVFAVPGLLFALVGLAIGVAVVQSEQKNPDASRGGMLCSGVLVLLAFACFATAIRELWGQRRRLRKPFPRDEEDDFVEDIPSDAPVPLPRLLAREVAEAIVRRVAEKHGAKGIVRKLGKFRASHLANAAAGFADQMGDDETPLTFVDRSFLGNGKAGFLVTNRGLYSSFHPDVLWLKDIHVVSYATPGLGDTLASYTLPGRIHILSHGIGHLQNRLFVNGKVVYSSPNPLTEAFWIEFLTALGDAAREKPLSVLELEADDRTPHFFRPEADQRPKVIVLETTFIPGDGQHPEVRRLLDPTWAQIEQAIRELDQIRLPSLRLSMGEASLLDVLGGNGKYVLRQPDGGWIYYDPSQGEEDIEVCPGGERSHYPAFFVCTDLDQVLTIARQFVETGTFE